MNTVDVLRELQARYGSADWSRWQVSRWLYWDFVRYPVAGTTQLSFFSVPKGSADPVSTVVKTSEETNLDTPRSFGQVYYIIHQIRTHVAFVPKARQATGINNLATLHADITAIADDLGNLMRRGVLNISILQKEYYDIELPFTNCPPGFGIDIHKIASLTNTLNPKGCLWITQNNDCRNVFTLSPVQVIEPNNTFSVTIDFPTTSEAISQINSTNAKVNIGVIFDGYIARPAQ